MQKNSYFDFFTYKHKILILKYAYCKPFKYAEVKPTCFVAYDLMSNSNSWPIRVFRIFILEILQKMGVFDFSKNGHEIDWKFAKAST